MTDFGLKFYIVQSRVLDKDSSCLKPTCHFHRVIYLFYQIIVNTGIDTRGRLTWFIILCSGWIPQDAHWVYSYVRDSGFSFMRSNFYMTKYEDSQPQPQPDSVSARPFLLCFIFYVSFSCVVSLIKVIINCYYWQSHWILLHLGNIHILWGWVREFQRCLAQPQLNM